MRKKYLSGLAVIFLVAITCLVLAIKPKKEVQEKVLDPASCKTTEHPCQSTDKPSAQPTTLDQLSNQFIRIPLVLR